eukprot:3388537-Pyramimonas_sp.AAC.1
MSGGSIDGRRDGWTEQERGRSTETMGACDPPPLPPPPPPPHPLTHPVSLRHLLCKSCAPVTSPEKHWPA